MSYRLSCPIVCFFDRYFLTGPIFPLLSRRHFRMQSHDAKVLYASFKRRRDAVKTDVLYSSLLGSSLGFGIGFLASQALQAQSHVLTIGGAMKLAVTPFVGPARVGVLCALLGGVAASVYVYTDSSSSLDSAAQSLAEKGVPAQAVERARLGDLQGLAQWSAGASTASARVDGSSGAAVNPAALR